MEVIKPDLIVHEGEIQNKASKGFKWSFLGQILAKLISPIANMILARLVVPEVFGIIAAFSIVITFCDIINQSGFYRYIIYGRYRDLEERNRIANVGFWSNLAISLVLFTLAAGLSNPLTSVLGAPGYALPFIIFALQIPLGALKSMQSGILERDFAFKKMFFVNIASALMPLFVTLPLAFILPPELKFWALVTGTLAGVGVQTLGMFIICKWKPRFFFSFKIFRQIFGYSGMSLLDALLAWFCTWADIIIITLLCNMTTVGLYREPFNIIFPIFAMVSASITPVALPALARLRDDPAALRRIILKMQKVVAYIVMPMAAGILLYQNFCGSILLGTSGTWDLAFFGIGLLGFAYGMHFVISGLLNIVPQANGKIWVSCLWHVAYLIIVVGLILTASLGKTPVVNPDGSISYLDNYNLLIWLRSACYILFAIIKLVIVSKMIKLPFKQYLASMLAPFGATMIMVVFGGLPLLANNYLHNNTLEWYWDARGFLFSILIYVVSIALFFRRDFKNVWAFLKDSRTNIEPQSAILMAEVENNKEPHE